MKRYYKTIISIISVILVCAALFGCTFYTYEQSSDGRFAFGVNKRGKDVFCMSCEWSGGDTSFVIPDEFMGYKVTTLGGYAGRGVPSPFSVQVDLRELYPHDGEYGEYSASDDGYFDEHVDPADDYDILTFNIHLGKNIVNLNYIDGKKYYYKNLFIDDNIESDCLCKIVYYFTVDENNPKLYAEGGKLYYRESGELVTDFFYE